MKKMVENTNKWLRTLTPKRPHLSMLLENIIFSIGRLMKITSQDAHFTNRNATVQKPVCGDFDPHSLHQN